MATISYAKTVWKDRDKANNEPGTKLTSEHLTNIEDGIGQLVEAVNAISPATGTGLTSDQVKLLDQVGTRIDAVEKDLAALKSQFEAHVHSNVVGETTGEVVAATSSTTDTTTN